MVDAAIAAMGVQGILRRIVAISAINQCTNVIARNVESMIATAKFPLIANTIALVVDVCARIASERNTSPGTVKLIASAVVMECIMEEMTTQVQRRTGDNMPKCKFHYCNNAAANDCDFNLCGECCCGCSRHETRSGPIEADEHTSCCVCGYDFTEFDITLEDHQREGTSWCDHLTQYKKEEENGYVYAYCACCEKCLGLATW